MNLVLCGPILRRVEFTQVSVFVATRRSCAVTLIVYANNMGKRGAEVGRGKRATIALGDAHGAHAVVVTARPGTALSAGRSYIYELRFNDGGHELGLYDDGVLVDKVSISRDLELLRYPGQAGPGFEVPSSDVARVRVLHGSCRKPHGEGNDALAYADELIANALANPAHDLRPQQLFLTGDQIYADDVDPSLLTALRGFAYGAIGDAEERNELAEHAASLAPGQRAELCKREAKLSSGQSDSHLITLGEFYAMYFFVWSRKPWQSPDSAQARKALAEFETRIEPIQRALANISTYMVWDDHEVTDDWYIRRDWCDAVLGNPLGRRILRNAMTAYAVFQHWGNVPDTFLAGPGAELLASIDGWTGEANKAADLDRLLPIPNHGDALPTPGSKCIDWSWRWIGPVYDVIALDTRTRRAFHRDGVSLMNEVDLDRVLGSPPPREFTIVVSPTPILGVQFIERLQTEAINRGVDPSVFDVEHWANHKGSYNFLLERLLTRSPVLALSGDVHYGFGASLRDRDAVRSRIVNLTSSALHNQPTTGVRELLRFLNLITDQELKSVGIEQGSEAIPSWNHAVGERAYVETLLSHGPRPEVAGVYSEAEGKAVLHETRRRDRSDVTAWANLGDFQLEGHRRLVHRLWYAADRHDQQHAVFWLRSAK